MARANGAFEGEARAHLLHVFAQEANLVLDQSLVPSVRDEVAGRAVTWREAMMPTDRLARCGVATSKFERLPTL